MYARSHRIIHDFWPAAWILIAAGVALAIVAGVGRDSSRVHGSGGSQRNDLHDERRSTELPILGDPGTMGRGATPRINR